MLKWFTKENVKLKHKSETLYAENKSLKQNLAN